MHPRLRGLHRWCPSCARVGCGPEQTTVDGLATLPAAGPRRTLSSQCGRSSVVRQSLFRPRRHLVRAWPGDFADDYRDAMNLQVPRRISNTRCAQSVSGGSLMCRSLPAISPETRTQDRAKTEGKIKGPARAGPQVLVCTLVRTARRHAVHVPLRSANPVHPVVARVLCSTECVLPRWSMGYGVTR